MSMARSRKGNLIPRRPRGGGSSHRKDQHAIEAMRRVVVKKDRAEGRREITAQMKESA